MKISQLPLFHTIPLSLDFRPEQELRGPRDDAEAADEAVRNRLRSHLRLHLCPQLEVQHPHEVQPYPEVKWIPPGTNV
jgi:hypothetical protein